MKTQAVRRPRWALRIRRLARIRGPYWLDAADAGLFFVAVLGACYLVLAVSP